MAVEIKPAVQSLPATTAIQDPAARRFADAVTQAVQSINSAEFAAQSLVTALEQGLRGGGVPGAVAADGDEGGITAGMISSILQSRLYQALGRAIERIPVPGTVRERIAALETGLTTETSVRATEREMVVQQINAVVARAAGAEAGIYQEALARATADEAMTSQIDSAVSRIGVAEAGLLSEQNTRATSDTALVQAINTMWAMTGTSNALIQTGGTVQTNWNWAQANWWNTLQAEVFTSGGKTIRQAISQEAEIRSGTDGHLLAQYTVKIDNNGYVSGFGFASSANNDLSYSEFYVRADRFAIGSPGVSRRVPFVVLTSADADGNPPGVYMDDAFIKNASIKQAKIGLAAVDTLRIGNNAVTVPVHTEIMPDRAIAAGTDPSFFTSVKPTYVQAPNGVTIFVNVTAGSLGAITNLWCRVRRNGAIIGDQLSTVGALITELHNFIFFDRTPPSGEVTYSVELGDSWPTGGPVHVSRVSVVALGSMK